MGPLTPSVPRRLQHTWRERPGDFRAVKRHDLRMMRRCIRTIVLGGTVMPVVRLSDRARFTVCPVVICDANAKQRR